MRKLLSGIVFPGLGGRRKGALCWLVACWLAVHLPASVLALDAKQVFDIVSPSTVFIEDIDGFGSGVFINNTGLILTNYHVVAANISLKVRAKVKFGNRVVVTELDDVKITHIHKDYDLALLQVKVPANGAFIPARVIAQAPPVNTGVKCFAVGNPGGPEGKSLELSITEGLVSSAFRKVDGLEYTQISAPINPGNSGGPVCDEFGQVIGIATWKMTETEGIGFAIPMQRLNMKDFIDPKTKPADMAMVEKAETYAQKYFALAQRAIGRDRELLLQLCIECYRVAMLASPNSPVPYSNLCVINQQLGNWDVSQKYAEAALRIDPGYSMACHMLGAQLIRASDRNLDRCLEIWFRGLTGTGDARAKGYCADDIGVAMINQQKWLAGGYILQWWETLAANDDDPRRPNRVKMWGILKDKLSPADWDAVHSKKDGFSKAQFDALAAGKPVADVLAMASKAPLPTGPGATPSAVAAAPVSSLTPEQVARLVKDAAAKFGPSLAPVPPDGLECPLPDAAGNAVLGYAGWKLVIHFPDLMKLGIFNLATAKMDGFIDCADRKPLFAAGGQVLTVYSPNTRALEIYDLATLKSIGSKTMPVEAPIRFIGMGLLDPSRVFVLQFVKNAGREVLNPSLLKVPDLSAIELARHEINSMPVLSGAMEGSMDDAGTTAAIAQPAVSPTGLGQFVLRAGNKVDFDYQHVSHGVPAMSADGKYLICRRAIFTAAPLGQAENPAAKNGSVYFQSPIAGYAGYVALEKLPTDSGFRVYGLPSMSPLVKVPVTEATMTKLMHSQVGDQIELMLASSYCDRIAYLLPREKKVMLFPLGLKSGAAGSGFAVPGKKFERKLTMPAGATVTLQSGPPGLKYDAATGALVWEVPADTRTGQVIQVIMLVKGADAKESYQVEKISVP